MAVSIVSNPLCPLAALACLNGCAVSVPLDEPHPHWHISTPEGTYQALAAIDYGQTLHIAREPTCYYEDGAIAPRLIGAHPNESQVSAYFAAQALVHFEVSGWLKRTADAEDSAIYRAVYWVWQGITIGHTASNIIRNERIGITPFGKGCAS